VRRVVQPLERLAREGVAPQPQRAPVREFALLNDALRQAARQDAQARQWLRSKADEFQTLFDKSQNAVLAIPVTDCDGCHTSARIRTGPFHGRSGSRTSPR